MTRRHPPLERLRAFAANEPEARERVNAHLQDCTSCRNTITVMRDMVAVAREDFAPAAPAGAFERVLQRRAAGERVILPVAEPPRPSTITMRRALPWAAAILFAAAGAAAAFPGSPLRQWLAARVRSEATVGPRETSIPAVTPTLPAPVTDTVVSGITVPVSSRELWVTVQPGPQPTRVRLTLSDAADVEVRAIGGAAGATFRPRADGVVVANVSGGEIQVDVPRVARRFVLRAGDVRYAVKDGDRLQVLAGRADTVAGAIVFQVRQ